MKIDNRFAIYKTLQAYKDDVRFGKLTDDSIVFVIEDRNIYTHKKQFGSNQVAYDYYDDFQADLYGGKIDKNAVVYIKDKAMIYAYGTYFQGGSGGGGGGGDTPISLDYPILTRTVSEDVAVSTNKADYIETSTLTSDYKMSVPLNNQYLHIAVPTQYSIRNVVTSNNETLSIDDDFDLEVHEIDGSEMNIYKYVPVIPPTFTLTFTFNIPQ